MPLLLPKTRNFLRTLITNDCAVPWFVYAETFFPAALGLAVALTIPDFNDMLRARGEALARGKGSTGRGLTHSERKRGGYLSPEHDKFAQKALKHLLVLTNPIEKAGYAWLLYNAVEEAAYNWQTAIEINSGCGDPAEAGPFIRNDHDFGMFPNNELGAMFLSNLEMNRAGWANSAIAVGLPPGQYTIIVAAKVKGSSGAGADYRLGIFIEGHFGAAIRYGTHFTVGADRETDAVDKFDFSLPFAGGGSVSWGIAGPPIPVGLQIAHGRVYVFRTG